MQFDKILFNGFEWDLGNSEKSQKHGLSLEEIEKVFLQKVLYFEDIRNSGHEKRFILVGPTTEKRFVFVAFTFRKRGEGIFIRVISARYMHKKEREIYEKIKKALFKES